MWAVNLGQVPSPVSNVDYVDDRYGGSEKDGSEKAWVSGKKVTLGKGAK